MTIETKAREWAEDMEIEVNALAIMKDDFIRATKTVAFESYLAGAAGAMEWIPVSEYDGDIREIEGVNHFLIPIFDASGDFTEWNIITGTPEDDTICGIDGIYHEVDVSQASHYMPVAKFPPNPEK